MCYPGAYPSTQQAATDIVPRSPQNPVPIGLLPNGRPILDNGNGSYSTERTWTVPTGMAGDWWNRYKIVPSLWNGVSLNPDASANMAAIAGDKTPGYPTIPLAEKMATDRSHNGGALFRQGDRLVTDYMNEPYKSRFIKQMLFQRMK